MTHWHIIASSGASPINVLKYEDGVKSVQDFLQMSRSIFAENEDSPVLTEQALIENMEGDNYPIWTGVPGQLVLSWIRCECPGNAWEN